jgi:hypothetical protein
LLIIRRPLPVLVGLAAMLAALPSGAYGVVGVFAVAGGGHPGLHYR